MDSYIFEFEVVDIRGETKKVLIKKKKKNLYRMLQLYTQFVVELLVVFSQVTFFQGQDFEVNSRVVYKLFVRAIFSSTCPMETFESGKESSGDEFFTFQQKLTSGSTSVA